MPFCWNYAGRRTVQPPRHATETFQRPSTAPQSIAIIWFSQHPHKRFSFTGDQGCGLAFVQQSRRSCLWPPGKHNQYCAKRTDSRSFLLNIQVIESVQLLSMTEPKDDRGYYALKGQFRFASFRQGSLECPDQTAADVADQRWAQTPAGLQSNRGVATHNTVVG